jgi:hypothetical protein
MGSGYWWVRRASKAVKEHRPAVNRMKNGNSFFGYTLTSWKTVAEQIKFRYEQKKWKHNYVMLAYLLLSREPATILQSDTQTAFNSGVQHPIQTLTF